MKDRCSQNITRKNREAAIWRKLTIAILLIIWRNRLEVWYLKLIESICKVKLPFKECFLCTRILHDIEKMYYYRSIAHFPKSGYKFWLCRAKSLFCARQDKLLLWGETNSAVYFAPFHANIFYFKSNGFSQEDEPNAYIVLRPFSLDQCGILELISRKEWSNLW